MADPELDSVLDALRRQGGRITTARRQVVATVLAARGHLCAEDIAADVQRTHPDIHLSTVYRILDDLERLGVLDHVHLRHGPGIYHLASRAHHHLVCRSCEQVTEVPLDLLSGLQSQIEESYGFALDNQHFALTGKCRSCGSRSRSATKAGPSSRR